MDSLIMKATIQRLYCRRLAAFSLVEVMVSSAILGIVATSLMAAFGNGFNIIKGTRLEQRATQILLEKAEVIRLFNWDQLTTPGVVPTHFSEPFFTIGLQTNNSVKYTGQLTISDPGLGNGYNSDVRLVTVDLYWTNDTRTIKRSISTYISRYGMQHYLF
jgi:prepilin-type N-terminal cleavage/methylation domain-containing protein